MGSMSSASMKRKLPRATRQFEYINPEGILCYKSNKTNNFEGI
jgi:hypothetical protein